MNLSCLAVSHNHQLSDSSSGSTHATWHCIGDVSALGRKNLSTALNASPVDILPSLCAIAEELKINVAYIQQEIALKRDPGLSLLNAIDPSVSLKDLSAVFVSCGRPDMYWGIMRCAQSEGVVIEPQPCSPTHSHEANEQQH